jgi:hypothetical protein
MAAPANARPARSIARHAQPAPDFTAVLIPTKYPELRFQRSAGGTSRLPPQQPLGRLLRRRGAVEVPLWPASPPCRCPRDWPRPPRRGGRAGIEPPGHGVGPQCPHHAVDSTRPRTLANPRSGHLSRQPLRSNRPDPSGGRPLHCHLRARIRSRQQDTSPHGADLVRGLAGSRLLDGHVASLLAIALTTWSPRVERRWSTHFS